MTLEAHNLEYSYTSPVLRGVSARFEPGQVTAILGPNGCGKTTLLRLLLGLMLPEAGLVSLSNRPINSIKPGERSGLLAYVPHRPEVGFAYTVREFVSFAHAIGPRSDRAIEAALDRLALSNLANRTMSSLSAGQAQRASIARALAQLDHGRPEARFLLADEPTTALDPRHISGVAGILRSLASDGLGVVVVLHDLPVACDLADRVILLNGQGQVHAQGQADKVLDRDNLEQVFETRFGIVEHEGKAVPMVSREPALR